MKKNLLKMENWQLNADELIEKKAKVRKMMWAYFVVWTVLWIVGSLMWLLTDDIVYSPWILLMSIIIIIIISMMKIQEFLISVIISIKWR